MDISALAAEIQSQELGRRINALLQLLHETCIGQEVGPLVTLTCNKVVLQGVKCGSFMCLYVALPIGILRWRPVMPSSPPTPHPTRPTGDCRAQLGACQKTGI